MGGRNDGYGFRTSSSAARSARFSFNYYNIYSIKNFKNNLKHIGFKNIFFKKFEIPFALKKNKNLNNMGTYTIKQKNKFIQLSGPILQNWYFVIAIK